MNDVDKMKELVEKLGEPFAKALATFIKEMMKEEEK